MQPTVSSHAYNDSWVRLGWIVLEILAYLVIGCVLGTAILATVWGIAHPWTQAILLAMALLLSLTLTFGLLVWIRAKRDSLNQSIFREGSPQVQALLDALSDEEKAELAAHFRQ